MTQVIIKERHQQQSAQAAKVVGQKEKEEQKKLYRRSTVVRENERLFERVGKEGLAMSKRIRKEDIREKKDLNGWRLAGSRFWFFI